MINSVSFAGRQEVIEQGLKELEKNKHNYTGAGKIYSQAEKDLAKALLEDSAEKIKNQVKSKAEYFSPFSSNVIKKNNDAKMMEKSYAESHGNKLNIIA